MGCELAGFESLGIIEWDNAACETLRHNISKAYPIVADWDVFEGDVNSFNWSSITQSIDLVAGGPPCQPFSVGGKHKGHNDTRDMFPSTVKIIRELRPKAFIIENVKGLTRTVFANYYQYILLQLQYPELANFPNENWKEHFVRLQTAHTSHDRTSHRGLSYKLVPTLVNAADYGVPQKRERVFIVGFRSDIEAEWSFPAPTHSLDALLYSQWITGEYWNRHGIPKNRHPDIPKSLASRLKKLQAQPYRDPLKPWRTVRDAIGDLPDPKINNSITNHRLQKGARVYPGHTGSSLDMPAKTLKAGDHGVPGGENMMIKPNGGVRYFTVRESARLQTFPDSYYFAGSWTESMRQIGNAVPVMLAQKIAASVAESLIIAKMNVVDSFENIRRSAA